jgi:hypothetical protein
MNAARRDTPSFPVAQPIDAIEFTPDPEAEARNYLRPLGSRVGPWRF